MLTTRNLSYIVPETSVSLYQFIEKELSFEAIKQIYRDYSINNFSVNVTFLKDRIAKSMESGLRIVGPEQKGFITHMEIYETCREIIADHACNVRVEM